MMDVNEYQKAKKRVEKFIETETGDEFGDPIDREALLTAMKDVVESEQHG